jgi:hypothetical protein
LYWYIKQMVTASGFSPGAMSGSDRFATETAAEGTAVDIPQPAKSSCAQRL